MRKQTEELYGADGTFLRHISMGEARQMEAAEQVERDWERDGSLRKVRLIFRLVHVPASDSGETPATLTLGDMQANVGCGVRRPAGKRRVKLAQAKVTVWPEIGDTRAVCVRPRTK